MDTSSGLMFISEDPKKHCGPLLKEGVYEVQVMNRILAEVQLTVSPKGPQTLYVVIAPVLDCIIRIDILSNNRILTLVPTLVRAINVRKDK